MINTSNNLSKRHQAGLLFFICSFLTFSMILGGSVYQLIAEIPNWSAQIPESLEIYRSNITISHAGHFFQSLVPISVISLVAAIILLWGHSKKLRQLLFMILAGILSAELFTLIYFLPMNFFLFFDPLDGVEVSEIIATADSWQTANYFRLAIVIATALFFCKTIYTLVSSDKNPGS